MKRIWMVGVGLLAAGLLLLGVFGLFNSSVTQAAPDAGAVLSLREIGSGFSQPLDFAVTGIEGDERIFIVQQGGLIRILNPDGSVNSTPFLDMSSRVSIDSERGLLGLAFDPDFETNRRFFINYTRPGDGATVVARFTVDSVMASTANAGSETVILTVAQDFKNHNGGDLLFGPDGYLYIPLGDGGSGNDPNNRAQDINTLLGSILRIDVRDGSTQGSPECGSGPYKVPTDNPFVDQGGCDEIWAYGVRNPWRNSFDRQTGDYYFGDVGQVAREEVNFQAAASSGGEDYGWRCKEGLIDGEASCDPANPGADYVPPFFDYERTDGRSVTGGYVYRGQNFPRMAGNYYFGDYATGQIWESEPIGGGAFTTNKSIDTSAGIATFGEDFEGELYMVDYFGGRVYRVVDEIGLDVEMRPAGPFAITETGTITFDVTNVGSQSAANIVLSATLPSGVNHISGGTLNGDTVVFDLGTLSSEQGIEVTTTFTATSSFTPTAVIASVNGANPVTGDAESVDIWTTVLRMILPFMKR